MIHLYIASIYRVTYTRIPQLIVLDVQYAYYLRYEQKVNMKNETCIIEEKQSYNFKANSA